MTKKKKENESPKLPNQMNPVDPDPDFFQARYRCSNRDNEPFIGIYTLTPNFGSPSALCGVAGFL